MAEDDEEGFFGGLYEDGHWVWDEVSAALVFVRYELFFITNILKTVSAICLKRNYKM